MCTEGLHREPTLPGPLPVVSPWLGGWVPPTPYDLKQWCGERDDQPKMTVRLQNVLRAVEGEHRVRGEQSEDGPLQGLVLRETPGEGVIGLRRVRGGTVCCLRGLHARVVARLVASWRSQSDGAGSCSRVRALLYIRLSDSFLGSDR